MIAKALQVPRRGVGFRVFGYDCGFSPLSVSSLLMFFKCEKRSHGSKCFLPKRRNVTPRQRTAYAKGLRVSSPFLEGLSSSRANIRDFSRASDRAKKKGEPRDFMLRAHFMYPRAPPPTFACIMHATKLNNVALEPRVLTSQYRVYASLCLRRRRDLRTITCARASASR